jgi:hypothetical protein
MEASSPRWLRCHASKRWPSVTSPM